MNSSHYDHEQDERDYYDRESEKHLKGCFFSFKSLAILTVPYYLIMLAISCAPAQAPATRSIGTVIQVDGDRVLVTFPVVNRNFSDQAANWFYIPGHSYEVRDFYPDPAKDPNFPAHERNR
uniref:hypothetical protein n=1 Tax=Algoriphagus sp. TaxID=1872435 RepID=UPI00258C53A5|nr:hypothetical protein [Algoriphagus sp.]